MERRSFLAAAASSVLVHPTKPRTATRLATALMRDVPGMSEAFTVLRSGVVTEIRAFDFDGNLLEGVELHVNGKPANIPHQVRQGDHLVVSSRREGFVSVYEMFE